MRSDMLICYSIHRDYVFFFSYIQAPPKEGGSLWSDAEEMTRLNGVGSISSSSCEGSTTLTGIDSSPFAY
jgi:hypothetical protein